MQRKNLKRLLLSGLLCVSLNVLMLNAAQAETRRIGIIPLQYGNISELSPYATGTQDALIAGLTTLPDWIVVDRSRMGEVMREHGFQQSQWSDPANQSKLGKLLGVDFLYTGSIQKSENQLRISIVELNVSTGQTRSVATVTGESRDIFKLQDQLMSQLLQDQKLILNETRQKALSASLRPTNNPKAYDLFLKANSESEQKFFEMALSHYAEAIQLDPGFGKAYHNRGNLYFEMGDFKSALTDLELAIKLLPNEALPYYNKARLMEKTGQIQAAYDNYSQAIAVNSNLVEAHLNRGNILYDHKQYQLALQDYNQVILLNPTYTLAFNNRGNLYKEINQLDLALADYKKALELNPQLVMALYNRANLYANLQNPEQYLPLALADYTLALSIQPEFAAAYNNRGLVYAKQNQFEAAVKDYSNAIRLAPQLGVSVFLRGKAYEALGRCELANADYAKACEMKVNMPGVCQVICKPDGKARPLTPEQFISQLFETEPPRWGLRGDPHLWQSLKEFFASVPMPTTETELQGHFAEAFETITKHRLDVQDTFYVESLAHGGMSSGMIDPQFWRERIWPLVLERFKQVRP